MCKPGRAQALQVRCWIILAMLLVQFMEGCGIIGQHADTALTGNPSVREIPAQAQQGSTRANVHPVLMQPQQPVAPPVSAAEMLLQRRAAGPPPVRYPADRSQVLARDGSDFITSGVPANLVVAEGPLGIFAPSQQPGSPMLLAQLALAAYEFTCIDALDASTVGLLWDGGMPLPADSYWLAVANWQRQRWDWYAGPADSVLTLPGMPPYTEQDTGRLLLIVLVCGNEPHSLARISLGTPELRGTGAIFEPAGVEDTLPPFPPAGSGGIGADPVQVDLSSACAPVRDQGQAMSSTAFAIADGAYNYELNRIYHSCGWDLSQPVNQCSPKYLYQETGLEQNLQSPEEGRYTGRCIAWLTTAGVATEYNAAYDNNYNEEWNEEALADAALLSLSRYYMINPAGQAGVDKVKTVLARFRTPVVLRLEIDPAFYFYAPGTTWNFSGPAVSGHALLLVGYDDLRQAFKARNSWSAAWGEGGYVWLGYDTFIEHSAQAKAQCWFIADDYDAAAALRFCQTQPACEPPTKIEASQGTQADKIVVTWQRSKSATQYFVSRDLPDNIIAVLGDVCSWEDTSPGNSYCHAYWIRAANESATSDLSTVAFGYTTQQVIIHNVVPGFGFTGQPMQFCADVTGAEPRSYAWDFGGGAQPNTSADSMPTVTASTPGVYIAYLSVSNIHGTEGHIFGLAIYTPIFLLPDAADADWGDPVTGSGTEADPYFLDGQDLNKEYSLLANTQADGLGESIPPATLHWEADPADSLIWTGPGSFKATAGAVGCLYATNTDLLQRSYAVHFVVPVP